MIAAICFLFPSALSLLVWKKIKKQPDFSLQDCGYYVIATLLVNLICLAATTFLSSPNAGLAHKLNTYDSFALKYLLLSITISAALPLAINFFQTRAVFTLELPDQLPCALLWRLIGIVCAIVLFCLHAQRITDTVFWGDECYSIMMTKLSLKEMLSKTAADVHPPLYYLILRLVCAIFGNVPTAYILTSLIPFGIVLCFSVTAIWNRFGKECAFPFMFLASFLSNSIRYIVEVRMYNWAALFVLLSFYYLHRVLHTNKNLHYFLFALFSLCAAYTHYYCVVIVAFFYMVLLLMIFKDKKQYLKKVLITSIATVICYLPWMTVLIRSFLVASGSFWLQDFPNFKESLLYLFNNKYEKYLLLIFSIVFILFLLKELGIFVITKDENKKIRIHINLKKPELTTDSIWALAGSLSILGTIFVGVAISTLLRPMLIDRYLYPLAIVAWLLLCFGITKFRGKQLVSLLLTGIILSCCLPSYKYHMGWEKEWKTLQDTTLSTISSDLHSEDPIYSDNIHFSWTIISYYFPENSCISLDENDFPTLEKKNCWFLMNGALREESVTNIEEQGYVCDLISTKGHIGRNDIYIYKVYQPEGA